MWQSKCHIHIIKSWFMLCLLFLFLYLRKFVSFHFIYLFLFDSSHSIKTSFWRPSRYVCLLPYTLLFFYLLLLPISSSLCSWEDLAFYLLVNELRSPRVDFGILARIFTYVLLLHLCSLRRSSVFPHLFPRWWIKKILDLIFVSPRFDFCFSERISTYS